MNSSAMLNFTKTVSVKQQWRATSSKRSRDPAAAAVEGGALHFSLRTLALLTLFLLISSQILLFSVWKSGYSKKVEMMADHQPLITHWKVDDNNQRNTKVRLRATESAEAVGFLPPGSVVQAYAYERSQKYLFLTAPLNGFALKKLFEPLDDDSDLDERQDEVSAFLYEGYRKEGRNITARYLYAPKRLVVAQQLWNALQVFQVFLALALFYVRVRGDSNVTQRMRWVMGSSIAVFLGLLLPFSVYVTSPGATLFALVSLATCIYSLFGCETEDLLLDIGEKAEDEEPLVNSGIEKMQHAFANDEEACLVASLNNNNNNNGQSNAASLALPAWFLVKEELLGFLCNLASSLYNYHNSHKTWPHWRHHFYNIDNYFDWTGGDGKYVDMFNPKIYTLGLKNVDVPLYVPGARGSTTGGYLFWILWSIIPVIYVSYFLCMYLLAPRSPGVKIQRALLLFAMFHFLFMTDVVSYKYGRGYWGPTAELFHWFERWAWRVAVLMPMYQNCTTGHWKHGHDRFPLLGSILHYASAIWGLGFFVLQVVFSDCVRFFLFLTGGEVRTLYELLGISSPGVDTFHPFSYHGGLVIMWVMYLVLLFGGFTPFHVSLQATMRKAYGLSKLKPNPQYDSENFNFEVPCLPVGTLSRRHRSEASLLHRQPSCESNASCNSSLCRFSDDGESTDLCRGLIVDGY